MVQSAFLGTCLSALEKMQKFVEVSCKADTL